MKNFYGADNWQGRLLVLAQTDADARQCCAIIRSSLHNNGVGPHTFPRYAYDEAFITVEGHVISRVVLRQGGKVQMAFLGDIKDLIDKFRRLCDDMNLTDAERMELFLCFRQWFKRDYRATSNMEDDY